MEQILRAYTEPIGSDWDLHLSACEYDMNDVVHATTNAKPVVLMYGESPCTQLDSFIKATTRENGTNPTARKFVGQWKRHLRTAQLQLSKSQVTAYAQFSKDKRSPAMYGKEDLVMLSAKAITAPGDRGTKWKLRDQWYGPLTVLDTNTDDYGQLSAVRLQLPHQWRARDWFALEKIKQYLESDGEKWPSRVEPPPPDAVLVDGQRENIVEQILGHRPAECKRGLP